MAKEIHTVRESDSLEAVEMVMRRAQVRRVPVLDRDGRLTGILSMNDLARHAHRTGRKGDGLRPDSIVQTLAVICEPRAQQDTIEPKATASAARTQLPA